MLLRALGINETEYQNCFPDVSQYDWFAGYIQAAYDNKIFEGSDGNANPDDLITREQSVKIMLKALETVQTVLYPEEEPDFNDNAEISGWAKPYVTAAVDLGLVNGTGEGNFSPLGNTLREQAMVMVYRVIQAFSEE
jgi:hypothetical protein